MEGRRGVEGREGGESSQSLNLFGVGDEAPILEVWSI